MKNGCILTFLLIFLSLPAVKAQTNKIGIVFDADTTLTYQYVGLTAFTNFTKDLPIHVDVKGEVLQKLESYLGAKYVVEMVELPDSLKGRSIGFFDGGIGRKLRKWTKTVDQEFDIIIFIRNQEIPPEWQVVIAENTNGLYTRHNHAHLFTTITFYAYRTSNGQELEYYNLGGDLLHKLKKFKSPKSKEEFSPAALNFLEEEYKKYLDERVKYFLVKSNLMSKVE
ncbi:hypothetical protein [Bacteroides sp. 51]|uniref:hypothetical protein n=1 Tax=Bacteroides sp. 51 TaxID=2302938 RepID=UPI0013D09BF0|nr:hypothetical protein [Bacteroides sp. 51]NDV83068.1 hypothetical protein [Bacteroides sp. 51]